jgi:mono/diheme cytochrome c family protein
MQPWGVAGGGPKNEQAIEDLISFLRTIQLSPGDAQKQAAEELAAARTAADDQVSAAQEDLDAKRKALGDAEDELRKIVGDPNADEATLSQDCVDLREQIRSDPDAVDRDEAKACATYTKALAERDDAVEALDWARRWAASRGDVTDGQLLFELFCARCHTEGWSVFNPAEPNGTRFLGLAGGGGGAGGGIGFNLRDGAPQRRFGEGSTGAQAQVDFVTSGSEANKAYGRNGQGSGRMPGFAQMLTKDMIEQIVEYEREGLDATEFVAPSTTEESSR